MHKCINVNVLPRTLLYTVHFTIVIAVQCIAIYSIYVYQKYNYSCRSINKCTYDRLSLKKPLLSNGCIYCCLVMIKTDGVCQTRLSNTFAVISVKK